MYKRGYLEDKRKNLIDYRKKSNVLFILIL